MDDRELLLNFIDRNLPDMTKDFDEGLGIASERIFLNRIIRKVFDNDQKPKTVLEAPVDGLMGIPGMNSVVFARIGSSVTVCSPSEALLDNAKKFWSLLKLNEKASFKPGVYEKLPFPDGSFDLVWNYCMFEHFKDGEAFLNEMKRVSKKYVFLATQNFYNYGYIIHKYYHFKNKQVWDHGYVKWMRLGRLKKLFKKAGLKIMAKGCFDTPPWFDTFDMHTRGKIKAIMSEEEKKNWYWSSLPEGDEDKLKDNKWIKRLELFEKFMIFPLNYLFAHHFYIIGEKNG
ncbi:MAG: class I SAM-dependent methyltransferase [Candidatus Firestonebacteria bacterium]